MDTSVNIQRPRGLLNPYIETGSEADLFTLTVLKQVETVPTANETHVTRMIKAASAFVRATIGFDPWEDDERVGRFSGDGTSRLVLGAWPITAVESLSVGYPSYSTGGAAWTVLESDGTADTGQDVLIPTHGRWLEARYKVFPEGVGNILAEYTAGWAVLPADLVEAAIMICRLCMGERDLLLKGSETIGPINIQQVVRSHRAYPMIADTLKRYALVQ